MLRIWLLLSLLSASVAAQNLEPVEFERPLRELSVIVTENGYYPKRLIAFEGERVRLFVTSTASKNQCLILQKHPAFIAAEKGAVNEATIDVDQAGRYKFYCPSFKYHGLLTVIQKNGPAKSRVPAAEPEEKPKYWTPRDFDP